MAAPKKYGDDLRAAVHELINEDGRAATEIAPILKARGFNQIPPIDTMRDWARASRHTITDKSKPQQLKELTGLAVTVIHAGFSRIQAENADSDADEILKLVRSLRELEPLLTDTPKGKDTQKPLSLLEGIGNSATPQPSGNTGSTADAPVSTHAA
jgi:hypothetical protein